MIDLFISYSRGDRDIVERLAALFEGRGWSIWREHYVGAGDAFDRQIEQAIQQSRLVLVVWSTSSRIGINLLCCSANEASYDSTKSDWARVDAAASLHCINTHTLPFRDWNGSPDVPELQALVGEVTEFLAAPASSPPVDSASAGAAKIVPAEATGGAGRWSPQMAMVGTIAVLVAAAAGIGTAGWRLAPQPIGTSPPPTTVVRVTPPPMPALPAASERNPTSAAPADTEEHVSARLATVRPVKSDLAKPAVSSLGEPIYFEAGTATLSMRAQSVIDRQGTFLREHPDMIVRIESYSQTGDGSRDALTGLAELRGYEVRRALTQRGVDAARMSIAVHVNEDASVVPTGPSHPPRVVLTAGGE